MKMKRLAALFLLLCLSLPLFSCTQLETEEQTETKTEVTAEKDTQGEQAPAPTGTFETENCLSAGYARGVITPKNSVPLAGYGNTSYRLSKTVLDDLYFTIIALTDAEGETVLICTVDLIAMRDSFIEKSREILAKSADIPIDNVFISSTHTHSGPDQGSSEGSINTWKSQFYKALPDIVRTALADRDKTRIYAGSAEVEGLNFVRRYVHTDGTYSGSNYGSSNAPIASHESEADRTVQIIKFDRENQNDIILANFQAHPCFTGGSSKTQISADYIGVVREIVEKETGADFAFFQGAAGNLNGVTKIADEVQVKELSAWAKTLSDAITKTLPSLSKIEGENICVSNKKVTAEINHTTDHLVEQAKAVSELFSQNDRAGAAALCTKYGFSSAYAAGAIRTRASMPASSEIDLIAVSVGGLAFVGAPYEMFDESGMQIKAASVFDMTFICEQTNGGVGYMPTLLGFSHGGYEPDTCKFIPGTAEMLAEEFITMLKEIHTA